jgi:Type IV secretion-system coupling protein DNA-binding domain
MVARRDNLLRGQGLLQQGWSGLVSRWKLYLRIWGVCVAVGAVAVPYKYGRPHQVSDTFYYAAANVVMWIASGKVDPKISVQRDGQTYPTRASVIASDPYRIAVAGEMKAHATLGGVCGALIGFGLCFVLGWFMRESGSRAGADRVISGSAIVSERRLRKLTKRSANARSLHIATVPILAAFECRHFALLGTTGSGKTTVLRQMLDAIETRGEPALVYDTSGEFIAHYYRPERGDVILNPFDARSAYWSPFAEIAHPADADRIAQQLITATGREEEDVWLETSRILVANILRLLWREGKTTLPALIDALQLKTKDALKVWLAGTSSARTFEEDADRASASVLFMLAKASNLLQFLVAEPDETGEPSEAGTFAFRDFIAGLDSVKGAKPWIFVPRKEDYFEAMKPLMACWLECAASATLGLLPSPTRRIWFVLDELADLPRVDNLTRLLPEGRKFGASVVLTFQSIGQMHARYGRDSAEAILGCCNTKLYLQLVDRDTREWASKTIGDVEVEIRPASDMLEYSQDGARSSLGTVRHIRAAVLESELRLPPYEGYLQCPDALPVATVTLTNAHIKARGKAAHKAFIAADMDRSLWGRLPQSPKAARAKAADSASKRSARGDPSSAGPV